MKLLEAMEIDDLVRNTSPGEPSMCRESRSKPCLKLIKVKSDVVEQRM